ncbi:MAG TPA: condensation domain-containing protein, partial [Longimicrobiaceae bacterium]
GGHSLLATRVVSRVRRAFGVEVPLRALFEHPTVAGLAEHVEGLLRTRTGVPAPPLRRVPRDRPLPLSFAQQRLWLIDRMDPGSAAYNVPAALRLRGVLDERRLRRALSALVRRHEALRTVFAEHDGEAVQVVRPAGPVPFPLVDLAALAAERRESEAARLAAGEALRPFDLARGPLLRATLVRVAKDDHAVLFTLHHVVSDEWSMEVLVREVSALYAGSPLPELPVQYADFAAWQREWLSGGVLDSQLRWWSDRLAGAPPVLELPADGPRRAVAGAPAAHRHLLLDPEASRGLREVARRGGATTFMALLAAWQLLLSRWSGQDDVVVGSPIAGRTRAETEGLIGFFVNTLVLRTDLSGDPSFRELVARAREATLGAFAHQDLPFERLVEELAPERSLAHTPLFQVMFAFQTDAGAGGALRLEGIEAEPLGDGPAVAKFDLSLTVSEEGEQLSVSLVYRADLYEDATAGRMLRHFGSLAARLAAEPDRPVGEADLLDPAERAQLLVEWNDTAREYPRESVHELFAEQAARTPDAPALVFGGETLTYAELDARAARLARRLRERGVGPETRVGICAERSAELVTAMLAVLRAGGAYVPLDPAYPAERLAFMLADSGARVVVAQPGLEERVAREGVEVVLLGEGGAAEDAPELPVEPDSLAYVIYTSGSTGTPKGVAVPHRGVVRLVRGTDYVQL